MSSESPIALIVYAQTGQPLGHLAEEARDVQEILRRRQGAGCEVHLVPAARRQDVFAALQSSQNRGRIVLFHYAGHAKGEGVVLQGDSGDQMAFIKGLAGLLGQQKNLHLVFLNGCATEGQVLPVLEAGIPAVIATSRGIDDRVAKEFACAFYDGLAERQDIQGAFTAAEKAIEMGQEGHFRGAFGKGSQEQAEADAWPWKLVGTSAAKSWTLDSSVVVRDAGPGPVVDPVTVFLAETFNDEDRVRKSVVDYLTDMGHVHVPESAITAKVEDYHEAIQEDLQRSKLFVQLLTPRLSTPTNDFETGLEGIQLAAARAQGLPVLRWRSPAHNPSNDKVVRGFLEDEVIVTHLENFKSHLRGRIETLANQARLPSLSGDSERLVLLHARAEDMDLANEIGDKFMEYEVGSEILDDGVPLVDAANSEDFRDILSGICVVYGDGGGDRAFQWVREQLRALRALVMKMGGLGRGVFVSPESGGKVPIRFTRLHIMEELSPAAIQPFLDDLPK